MKLEYSNKSIKKEAIILVLLALLSVIAVAPFVSAKNIHSFDGFFNHDNETASLWFSY